MGGTHTKYKTDSWGFCFSSFIDFTLATNWLWFFGSSPTQIQPDWDKTRVPRPAGQITLQHKRIPSMAGVPPRSDIHPAINQGYWRILLGSTQQGQWITLSNQVTSSGAFFSSFKLLHANIMGQPQKPNRNFQEQNEYFKGWRLFSSNPAAAENNERKLKASSDPINRARSRQVSHAAANVVMQNPEKVQMETSGHCWPPTPVQKSRKFSSLTKVLI